MSMNEDTVYECEDEREDEKLTRNAEDELRRIEGELEAVGRMICSAPGSATAHGHIDLALAQVRDAIRSCYMMVGTGIKK